MALHAQTQLFAKEVIEGRRYSVYRNEAEAAKDAAHRQAIVAALDQQLERGDKALIGNSAHRRYLRTTSDRRSFEIDAGKLADEARYDGIFVLRTNARLSPLQAVVRYRDLIEVEALFRTAQALMRTRQIYHASDAAIRAMCSARFSPRSCARNWTNVAVRRRFDPSGAMCCVTSIASRISGSARTATGVIGPLFKAARVGLSQNVPDISSA